MGYDPNSSDAAFARLFERLDHQDAALKRIEDRQETHGDRLVKLEREKIQNRLMSLSGLGSAAHHVTMILLGK